MLPSAARALKIENAWGASELKMRNRELAKAQQNIMYVCMTCWCSFKSEVE